MKTILVIGPHTDDIELGCGALVHKVIRERGDASIICISLSHHFEHPVTRENTDLLEEWHASCKVLGVSRKSHYEFKARNFDKMRQDILQTFIDIKKMYNPDIVIVPCTKDVHQDHQVVTIEAIRAFKNCTILGYILPWNIIGHITPTCFVEVFDIDVQAKVKAFSKFTSQVSRPYTDKLEAVAITTGAYIEKPYAEGFEAIRIKDIL